MDTIAKYCGCLPCLLDGLLDVHATIQHVVEGYRVGHTCCYGSCRWHHQGYQFPGVSVEKMEESLGPSMAVNAGNFHKRYGSERELAQIQDYVLGLFADDPWPEYSVPRQVARDVRTHWKELKHATH